ncbi:MAG: VWA domain-containing protein, partial [Xanthobacteraceae bacterium]
MADDDLPGGAIARRTLHFIFIADCSGSMAEAGKIQSLNHAIREAIPHMRKVAGGNPNAEVLVRSIKFSDGALWHQPDPTDVQNYEWTDLKADGGTDMGGALSVAAKAMRALPHGDQARMFPPVLVLISDGAPNSEGEFDAGLKELLADPW